MSSDSTKGEHSSRIQQKSDPQQVSDRIFFIDASNQSLLTIPADILALRELEEVHLENNLIAEIPKDIQHLRKIRVLYLNKNKLKKGARGRVEYQLTSPLPQLGEDQRWSEIPPCRESNAADERDK